ncbi:hypothetical protein GA0070616_1363 [Micromonospora nigra]|uniref:Uncharacterized protein n=1 Tax=Micromonospora nigra TaxID=145857 RepID=A0A1C6RKV4_9ACTN|nr:hypothetical protein [Micromonospora nigra]SCL17807.1 hypothetical protein GA0070616_1363 [Micromonospora nigra]
MTSTIEQNTTADPRAYGLALVTEGVATGLPVPTNILIGSTTSMSMQFSRHDTAAVDRWATYLELPAPTRQAHVFDVDRNNPWQTYSAEVHRSGNFNGWSVTVWCAAAATADAITKATTGGAK